MITVTDEGGVRWITLDRADKANALTRAMLEDIAQAAGTAGAGCRALVLTGAGGVFSAGADLAEVRDTGLATDPVWTRAAEALAAFPGLTIAALNGTLAGGGFALALACDLRLAVPGAEFFYPVMRLGHLPQPADPARLERLVGPGRARLLLLAGVRITAAEALDWGLVERVVPPDALADTARAMAGPALAAPSGHPGAIKAMFPRWRG